MIDAVRTTGHTASRLYLRTATPADQAEIRRLVGEARINPMGLHWPNFLIAQDGDAIVGIGQVKPHRDGSRELASIAVIPSRQGEGIASALIHELLRREQGDVYLYCASDLAPFYARYGFFSVPGRALPRALRRTYRLPQIITFLARAVTGQPIYVAAMMRPSTATPDRNAHHQP